MEIYIFEEMVLSKYEMGIIIFLHVTTPIVFNNSPPRSKKISSYYIFHHVILNPYLKGGLLGAYKIVTKP